MSDTNATCPITTEYAVLLEYRQDLELQIREKCEEEYRLLENTNARLAELREPAKAELRERGIRRFTYGNFEATVKSPPMKTTVDTSALVRRATEERDLATLLQYQVLTYEVNHVQIARLPDSLKTKYAQFVTTTEGTAAVSLPS